VPQHEERLRVIAHHRGADGGRVAFIFNWGRNTAPIAVVAATVCRLDNLPTQPSVSEFNQPGQFLLLLGDPVRGSVFIFSTRVRSGLFDQLIDILPYHGNALVKFSNCGVSHRLSRVENIQLSWGDS
jgi:hypothetical protein